MVSVTFDGNPECDDFEHYFPLTVSDLDEVLYDLSSETDGIATQKSQAEISAFAETLEPRVVINGALEIITDAPTFDDIEVSEVEERAESISVTYTLTQTEDD